MAARDAQLAKPPAVDGSSSRKRKAFAGSPPAAGSISYAQLWWYRDNHGVDQGPFDTATMRGWFVGGCLPAETPLAASYYGEVPQEMWVASELWEHPQEEAFVMASDAVSAPQIEPPQPDFIESQHFEGGKVGFVFKHDIYGCGYYKDEAAHRKIEVTLESILAEKAERQEREARSMRNALPKFDSITA